MIIGITGSFGSGKTMVSDIFKIYGFEVINVDRLYHSIYEKDSKLKNELMEEFGTLEREEIRKIAFNDFKKLRRLNEIAHPIIISELKKEISKIEKRNEKLMPMTKKYKKNDSIEKNTIIKNNIQKKSDNKTKQKTAIKIVIDVPLLFEAKMENIVDKIVVVKCDEKIQMERIMKKSNKYSKKEIKQIIQSQMPLKEKIKRADFVVDNSKDVSKTKEQVRKISRFIENNLI